MGDLALTGAPFSGATAKDPLALEGILGDETIAYLDLLPCNALQVLIGSGNCGPF